MDLRSYNRQAWDREVESLSGQCAAGFVITDLYEDVMSDSPLEEYHPNYIAATRAVKM